jgi:hypothetical protein
MALVESIVNAPLRRKTCIMECEKFWRVSKDWPIRHANLPASGQFLRARPEFSRRHLLQDAVSRELKVPRDLVRLASWRP